MLKKLLIFPLLSILSIGAFASAGFVSDCDITNVSYSPLPTSSVNIDFTQYMGTAYSIYICYNSVSDQSSVNSYLPNFNGVHCFNYRNLNLPYSENCVNSDYSNCSISSFDYAFFVNSDPALDPNVECAMTWVESSQNPDDGDSSYVPGIPDSFTSGLTSLLNNFGSTIVNWLPTIILVALGIYALFCLFRVVRNYARSSFRG